MTALNGFNTGQSVQALDQNQQLLARNGYGVVSGLTVSIYSGTLGANEATVEVASGSVLVGDSVVSVASSTVGIETADSWPRKDLLVYDPALAAGDRLTVVTGTPAKPEPAETIRQQAEQPAPPSLATSVTAIDGAGEPKIPIAEVWIPNGVEVITDADIADRRMGVAPSVSRLDAADTIATPELSGGITDAQPISKLDGTALSIDGDGTLNATNTHANVSDDGTEVTSDVTDINFTTNLSVTDDGDGSVSIDAGGAATDSRTNVSHDGSQVVSDVTDIDFTGNLAVADDGDGSVTVTGAARNTLYMSEYAPNGGVVDAAFSTAIADADPGDRIVFDRFDYELTQQTVIGKPLTIDQTSDSTLICSNTSNNDAHILFQGGGIQSSTTTTASTNQGQRTLALSNADHFVENDRVLVIADTYSEPLNAHIHFDTIESVDATNDEITLKGGLSRPFASGVQVNQVELLDSPTMKNLTTTGGGNRHLQFRWCEEPTYENVTVTEYLEVSLYTLDCWKATYRNVEATDPTGLGSGEGEPIALYRVQDAYIESPRVFDCRRGIDFSRGTRGVTVVDPVIRGVDRNGISVHQNDPADDITIIGGEIVCSQTGSVSAGTGITSADGTTMSIHGTRIVARDDGIIASGPTVIDGVQIEPVTGVSAPRSGIHVTHGSTHVTNTRIVDPDGRFNYGVWLHGVGTRMEDFTIDVETRRPGANHIYLDARDGPLSDIRLRGTLDNLDGASDHGIFVRADGTSVISNVDVSLTAEGFDEQVFRLLSSGTEQITNLNVHDSFFDCGLAVAYTDGTGSFGPIRFANNHMNTGSTSLSLDDPISKLVVLGNTVTGTIDTSGASAVYNQGNL